MSGAALLLSDSDSESEFVKPDLPVAFEQTLKMAQDERKERKKPPLKKRRVDNNSDNFGTRKVADKSPKNIESISPEISIENLAVTRKKIDELKLWIRTASEGNNKSHFLLLSGPPGSAKNTAVRAICENMKIEIVEWKNNVMAADLDHSEISIELDRRTLADPSVHEFLKFIQSASLFGGTSAKSIVIIKELPHALEENSAECEKVLLSLINARTPIIFITNTPRRYPELAKQVERVNGHVQYIKVNNTNMKKALVRLGAVPKILGPILEAADGDLRAAVNSLRFNSIIPSEKSSAVYLDSKLLLFRALGRILHSKRLEKTEPYAKTDKFEISKDLKRKALEYEIPEDQCTASGFQSSSFSQFLHHNCIPYVPDIQTYANFIDDFSLGDRFSQIFGYGTDKVRNYEAAFSCRSLTFWNHIPNKVGFKPQQKPAQIELRKKISENVSNVSCLKHRIFGGASQASIAMMDLPSLFTIEPKNPGLLALRSLASVRISSGFGSTTLEKDEDFRTEESQPRAPEPAKRSTGQKLDEEYESDFEIEDDDAW